jgi:hypothetical protein
MVGEFSMNNNNNKNEDDDDFKVKVRVGGKTRGATGGRIRRRRAQI